MPSRVIFVGQAPGRSAWLRGLELSRRVGKRPTSDPTSFAERYCARIALTGIVGSRLASMLGIGCREFARKHPRINLNARWTGKQGKGDRFCGKEAAVMAAWLLARKARSGDKIVLLWQKVAKAFSTKWSPLAEKVVAGHRCLLFPHPSGISHWWNKPENRLAAVAALNRFIKRT
jgi:hypothetical protein